MYYHFAILLLFRPLLKLRIVGSNITPRDVCAQAADAITGLLRSYSQLYTLRRTPSFVPYFVLTSSIMHLSLAALNASEAPPSADGSPASPPPRRLAKHDPHVIEALGRGIADLAEMAPCHHFAAQALNILKFLAKRWGIDVTGFLGTAAAADEKTGDPTAGDDPDEATRPVTSGLNFFAANFLETDFNCAWGSRRAAAVAAAVSGSSDADPDDSDSGPDAAELAAMLENPLFWPFPMQGRPILPVGKELKEAGFEMI